MTTDSTVPLFENATGKVVTARLTEPVDAAYARRADEAWRTYAETERLRTNTKGATSRPPPWQWEERVTETSRVLAFPSVGIEYDGHVQGLMMLMTTGVFSRVPASIGKPLVYIVYLDEAPWNDSAFTDRRSYSGISLGLLSAAIWMSFDLEFKGRVGVHAEPGSEEFYAENGMTSLGADQNKGGFEYFEMTAGQAADFRGQEDA